VGIKRTSHSVYDTGYHLVWCPKYRRKIFERVEVRERAGQMIREICEAYDTEILEMGVLEEHIHLLVSFPPSRSIGAGREDNQEQQWARAFPRVPGNKEEAMGGELWEYGYFARTVGNRMTRDVVAKYIDHHHELEQGPAQLALNLRS
jgi:putative transposase